MARLLPKANPYTGKPKLWVNERLGEFVWSKQQEIMDSVVENRHTAVQACHSPGKSHISSRIVAWWLDSHPVGSAFAVTTAPSQPQVEAILWRYMRQAHSKGNLPGRITLDCHWYLGDDEMVAYGRKPADYVDPEKAASAFQGIHAKYILIVLDEAGGIPLWLWNAVDSLASNEHARVLAIGNPDDPATQFEKVCRPGSGWHNIKISAFDTPAFTGEPVPAELLDHLTSPIWVEERKKRWGEDSPIYISKVLGEFPEVSEDTLIHPGWIKAAQERSLPGIGRGRYGVDAARSGKDEATIYRNRDGVIRREFAKSGIGDLTKLKGQVIKCLAPHKGEVWAVIDVIGIGAGVYDEMANDGWSVAPFNASERAFQPETYMNRRAEAYWEFRELFREGLIDIDPEDEDLAAQLGSMKWWVNSTGRIQIESKDDMKKRGLPSPDRADGAMMSCQAGELWVPDPNADENLMHTDDLLARAM
jgi:hypothetical protein